MLRERDALTTFYCQLVIPDEVKRQTDWGLAYTYIFRSSIYETSNQVDKKKLKINNTTKPTINWFPNVHGYTPATWGGRADFDDAFACAGSEGGGICVTYGRGGGLGECTAGRRS